MVTMETPAGLPRCRRRISTILVTGMTGHLGRQIVEGLLKQFNAMQAAKQAGRNVSYKSHQAANASSAVAFGRDHAATEASNAKREIGGARGPVRDIQTGETSRPMELDSMLAS